MFYQILFLIIGLFSFDYVRTKGVRPYFCDTQSKIDEIVNIYDNLKRFIRYKNEIYFVLKNRIIFTSLFLNETEDESNVLLVNHNFQQQETVEIDVSEFVPSGYEILGHNFDESKNEVTEYYITNNDSYKSDDQIYQKSYSLNFDQLSDRPLAARGDLRDLKEMIKNELINHLTEGKYNYTDILTKKDKLYLCVFYFFKTQLGTTEHGYRLYKIPDQKKYVSNDNLFFFGLQIVEYFTFFLIKEDTNEKRHKIIFTEILTEISSRQFLIRFAVGDLFEFNRDFEGRPIVTFLFDFDEFFSCHTRFTKDKQVRGIFLNTQNKLIYIFIKRFYLKLNSVELIENHFFLMENYFLNNAIPIHFETDAQVYVAGELDTKYRKWLKIDKKKKTLFTPESSSYFEIKLDHADDLNFQKTDDFSSDLLICNKQTLVIENVTFCFEEEIYFRIGSKIHQYPIHKIKTIFKDTPIAWPNSELQFIFNYVDNKFMMMTKSILFVFEYDKFQLIDNTLICIYTPIDKFERKMNYFYYVNEDLDKHHSEESTFSYSDKVAISFLSLLVLIIFLIPILAIYKKTSEKKSVSLSKFTSFIGYAKAPTFMSKKVESSIKIKSICEIKKNLKIQADKKAIKISKFNAQKKVVFRPDLFKT